MTSWQARRRLLQTMGLALAGAGLAGRAAAASPAIGPAPDLLEPGSDTLRGLSAKLAVAPRRRDFDTVPMILTKPDQWDAEALALVLASRAEPRQVWNNTEIGGYWLTVMRNALNTQIWGFRHPDFLVVSATHGSAGIGLYDQAMWDKYDIAKLLKGKLASNTLIIEKTARDPGDFENPEGTFSATDDSIPTLQRRGVVFLACHNAIWAHAELLIKQGSNPDKRDVGRLAAELTNHLVPGVVLTPGIVGTLPELQKAGFVYAAV